MVTKLLFIERDMFEAPFNIFLNLFATSGLSFKILDSKKGQQKHAKFAPKGAGLK